MTHSLPSTSTGIIEVILEEKKEEMDLADEDTSEVAEVENLMSVQLNFEKTKKTRKRKVR